MNIFKFLEEKLGKNRVLVNEPLSKHTTFQIGGPAKFYIEAQTVEELAETVELAKKLKLAYFILGGGSNILVGDLGFDGLVVKNRSKNIKVLGYNGVVSRFKGLNVSSVLVEVDSGVLMNQLVRFTIEEGLAGLEGFLGLPGTLGGAAAVNAHWKENGKEKGIRELVVSQKEIEGVILSATLTFRKEDKKVLWEKGRKAVTHRLQTQPVGPSAGCIFKNIKTSDALRVGTPEQTTSSGYLLEAAGLKGKKGERVQISPIHANFMINLGGAKAEEVLKLIEESKKTVKEKFGIDLEEEILKVGEF